MAYRDEEDALRARNEALQNEVEQLKRERSTVAEAHQRRLLEARRVGGLPPLPPLPHAARNRGALLAGMASVVLVCMGASFMVLRSGSSTRKTPAPAPSRVEALWHARVKSATGSSLQVGADCRLESTLRFPGPIKTGLAHGASMKVSCGSETLYDSSDHSELGSSTLSFDEVATPVATQAAESFTFDLHYDEEGERSRRKPMAAIDTGRGMAVFTRELPALRVELSIDPGSEPARVQH